MTCSDPVGDGWVAEELDRAIRLGVPYDLYKAAFISTADRSADDCADILNTIMKAAEWGAQNRAHVLTFLQVEEETDDWPDECPSCSGSGFADNE